MTDAARGFSLLELLVAMLLALFTALAALTLYRHSVQATFAPDHGAAELARQDQQVMAALLGMQTRVQEAGFGLSPAQPGRDLLLKRATLDDSGKLSQGTAGGNNTLLWRYKNTSSDSSWQCRGLAFVKQGIYQLNPTNSADCTALDSKWHTMRWQSNALASQLPPHQTLTIALAPLSCAPYQSLPVGQYQRVLFQFRDTARHIDRDFASCLVNFPA